MKLWEQEKKGKMKVIKAINGMEVVEWWHLNSDLQLQIEILRRLDMKSSVSRCRCVWVCRSRNQAISSPGFVTDRTPAVSYPSGEKTYCSFINLRKTAKEDGFGCLQWLTLITWTRKDKQQQHLVLPDYRYRKTTGPYVSSQSAAICCVSGHAPQIDSVSL